MAIKPKTKTAVKPAAKLVTKVKTKTTLKKAGEKKETRNGMVNKLLLEKTFSDEQIREKVNKALAPLVLNSVAISVARGLLNKALTGTNQIEALVEVDGKLIPRSKKPTSKGKRKAIDPANDPLSTVAGIMVKKKAAKPKAA